MVNVTASKITFQELTSSKMVQEMFESYFDNKPSARINEQINSFIIQNKPLIKLNAIKAFRELLIFDDVSTICFLSALRRYLKIDNSINSDDKNEQPLIKIIRDGKEELREATIEAISMLQGYTSGFAELLMMYELVVFNKEQRNYSRALQLIDEMLPISKDPNTYKRDFPTKDEHVHFLLSFDDPQKYIELQYNLIQSKQGFELKDMEFSSLHADIDFSNGDEDKNTEKMRDKGRALLSILDENPQSPTRVFEEFYLLILDVLIRRHAPNTEKQSNRDPENSFIGEHAMKFDKIKKLVQRSHLSNFIHPDKEEISQDGFLHEAKSARVVRETLSYSYKSTYNALNSSSKMSTEGVLFGSDWILARIGDIDLNAPLATPKNRGQWGGIHYFSNDKAWSISPHHDLQEKIQFDMSSDIQGKINFSNMLADAVFLNTMKVGKVQNSAKLTDSDEKKIRRTIENSNEFELLEMLHQKATGQTIGLSKSKIPKTIHSKETQNKLEKINGQDNRLKLLEDVFNFSTYFSRGYNVQPWLDSKDDKKITRSTKLDRLNVLAKGISELKSIVEQAIPHHFSKKINRKDLPASETQPLLILPRTHQKQGFSELDKTIFSIPFIVHRYSELINALTSLNQYKNNLPIPYPYMRRFPTLVNKYAALIQLEIKRMLGFIYELESSCGYNIDKKWKKNYSEHLVNLRQERNNSLKEEGKEDGKYKGKASAYKPLEIERRFVEAMMLEDSEDGSKPITSCLYSLTEILEDIPTFEESGDRYNLKSGIKELSHNLLDQIFSEDGCFSPNKLIVGKLVGVNLTRGWSD